MSRFRTAALGAVVVLGMAGVSGAQTQAGPDSAGKWNGRHGRHGQRAQAGRHLGGRGERNGHGKSMKDLNLSEAQKNQVKAIHAKYAPQMKTIREQDKSQFGSMRDMRLKGDTSAAARAKLKQQREQFRAKLMTVRQAEEKDVRAILSAVQRTKWDAVQVQRKQRMEVRMKGMKE